ncbi:MAG: Valine--tRNA ligase, partial [Pelotomaculum thermopropionicum]
AIRHIRSEMNLPPGRRVEVLLTVPEESLRGLFEKGKEYMQILTNGTIKIYPVLADTPENAAHAVTARGVEVFIPLKGLIDIERETARLKKELLAVEKDLARVRGKLKNQAFLAKAPAEVVDKEKVKEEEFVAKHMAVKERLQMLEGIK